MPRPLQFRRRWTGVFVTLLLLCGSFAASFTLWFSLTLSPLQKQYFPTYLAIGLSEGTARIVPVWWIWKTAPGRSPQLAADADVVAFTGRREVPLALSPMAQSQGWTGLLRARQRDSSQDEGAVLQAQFFAGQSLARTMVTPLCGGAALFLLYLALRAKFSSQSSHEERHGRRTRGPELISSFVAKLKERGGGIRLRVASKLGPFAPGFPIPQELLASHILLMGDTGSGKSNAMRQILRQVQRCGETAIVYDPAGEFVQEFYQPKRGDLILNPLDARCPFWNLQAELDGRGVEDAIAAAMLPEKQSENGFFTDAPRRVLASLLRKGGSVATLLEWMADPAEIERRLEGTPQAAYLDRNAGPQRAGVLASLNLIADSLDLLPTGEESEEWFSTGTWRFERTRWVFLTSRPALRERIRPLHSAWLDLFILRMMEPCVNPAKAVWFVLDELASLNKLPQLHTAVTENRKYGNPVVLGFQGRSQLEKRYGQDAEVMLSQPATKIFFKTSEPRAAKWVSETLGEVEVERLKESRTPKLLGSQKSFSLEIANKPLVMASEIAGLEPLHGFIKQENRVTPVRFAYVARRSLQPEFIERAMTIPEQRPLPPPTAVPEPASIPGPPPPEIEDAEPEPRKSAFKKKDSAGREWKPLD
ncbi:Type IV secretory pathway, VirD4 component, TraG/TraD family ATPase [Granulicella rosea]|uniref:Type IV secretory pathway, VirD4 component, TraG/TraD family ATPase n=1 Tax=Granulicella rosea TaxID=474952 RepID=A0A239MPR9_9BACT|nr:type IV secretion system DNA-binding domain-containing protein [Granulicella rosea]SNT44490.1 Type IV secretory pathway, VirD4 component, TraG/TraD family ATPase [Granulicella rosea]